GLCPPLHTRLLLDQGSRGFSIGFTASAVCDVDARYDDVSFSGHSTARNSPNSTAMATSASTRVPPSVSARLITKDVTAALLLTPMTTKAATLTASREPRIR